MAELPSFLQKGWKVTLLSLAVGLIAYWIGTKGQETVVLTPEPKIVVKVVQDTIPQWDTVIVSQTDTFWRSAPDTCQRWVNHYKALYDSLRDSVAILRATNRPGSLIFADSTYFKPYKLWIWGQFRYPSGEGGILYHWERPPYFSKPTLGFELGLPLLDFPWAKVDYLYKNNRWIGFGAQPYIEDSKLRSRFMVSHRWEF